MAQAFLVGKRMPENAYVEKEENFLKIDDFFCVRVLKNACIYDIIPKNILSYAYACEYKKNCLDGKAIRRIK